MWRAIIYNEDQTVSYAKASGSVMYYRKQDAVRAGRDTLEALQVLRD